jgi:carbonic anhydrase/acetyltransferase-like protein (isoleucine patch superfamily)
MPLIKAVKGVSPIIDSTVFIAENATIVGQVTIGAGSSVWFNAIIRGDVNTITIGERSNIQDAAMIHCTYQKASTQIGNDVSIGHLAIIHGCTIHDHVLIGMRALVMDHAVVEPYCIIAAGALVLENTICESGYIYAGSPAKKIKPISTEQRALLDQLPLNYQLYTTWF